jgi:sec-independent protein translocase protein TatA
MLAHVFLLLDGLGTGELVLIVVVFLMFFGSKKVPDLARGLGKGIREFKDAANGIQREIQNEANKIKEDTNLNDTKNN